MVRTNANIAEKLLELSKKYGSENADVIISKGKSTSIEVREGELEQVEGSEGLSISLRVINDQKSSIVSCSDANQESLDQLARKANEIANESIPNQYVGLAENKDLAIKSLIPAIDLSEPEDLFLKDPNKLTSMALEAENAALKSDGISKTDGSSASASHCPGWRS